MNSLLRRQLLPTVPAPRGCQYGVPAPGSAGDARHPRHPPAPISAQILCQGILCLSRKGLLRCRRVTELKCAVEELVRYIPILTNYMAFKFSGGKRGHRCQPWAADPRAVWRHICHLQHPPTDPQLAPCHRRQAHAPYRVAAHTDRGCAHLG